MPHLDFLQYSTLQPTPRTPLKECAVKECSQQQAYSASAFCAHHTQINNLHGHPLGGTTRTLGVDPRMCEARQERQQSMIDNVAGTGGGTPT